MCECSTLEGGMREIFWRWRLIGYRIAGSEDSDVYLWDVQSKDVVQILVGHEDVVLGVAAHPSDNIIASCGLDMTVKIWIDSS